MARIAFVLDEDFEDSEFHIPYDGLKKAGHQIVLDGTLITSREPADLPAFTAAINQRP